ncbi:MAG: 4-hydroxy-2-oxovalerate aldolase [Betaproteobacteria bacterium]
MTLRDGGLANNFAFTASEAAEIISELSLAGTELVEVGYFNPQRWTVDKGPGVCNPHYLHHVSAARGRARLGVMAHTWEIDASEYRHLRDFEISLVRLPVLKKNLLELPQHCQALEDAGIPYSLNLIRISEYRAGDLERFLEVIGGLRPEMVYLADSNGSMYPPRLTQLAMQCQNSLQGVDLGFHPHDNLSLAFSNTLTCLDLDFQYVDASIGGFGKGGCNLSTEFIMSYLNKEMGTRYDLRRTHRLFIKHIRKWMFAKLEEKFASMVFGMMNTNMDQVKQFHQEADQLGIPIERHLAVKYPALFAGSAPERVAAMSHGQAPGKPRYMANAKA